MLLPNKVYLLSLITVLLFFFLPIYADARTISTVLRMPKSDDVNISSTSPISFSQREGYYRISTKINLPQPIYTETTNLVPKTKNTTRYSYFYQGNWYYGISLGIGLPPTQPSYIKVVNVMPGAENTYSSNRGSNAVWTLGLLGQYMFDIRQRLDLGIGLELNYFDFGKITGVLHPLTNLSSNFDTLNYLYKTKSYVLMTDLKFRWRYAQDFFFTLFNALGISWNAMSDYSESMSPSSTTYLSQLVFKNKTSNNFVLSLGLGAGYKISRNMTIEMNYRYFRFFNLEKERFLSTVASLGSLSPLSLKTHMLYVSLLFD